MTNLPPSPSFLHLRIHSEYSIADGTVRIGEVVSAAKIDQMPAVALTDLSNLFGLVKFYKAARSAGIKPIMGCDVFVTNPQDRDHPARVLLLCQSNAGYLRLCDWLTRAYLENQYRGRPEIRIDWLQGGTEGLIALSGAQQGAVGMALLDNNPSEAKVEAQKWADLFPNRFYLEVQRTGASREEAHLRDTVGLANALSLPVVATHPVQFLTQSDFKAHEARVCIAQGYVLNDKRRVRAFTDQQYFKTQAEMRALFADLPEALQNSVEIAKRCNLTLKLGKPHLPNFPTPNGETLNDYLRIEAERGLEKRLLQRYPDETVRAAKTPEYAARLEFEINTITQMDFPGYFLIVADFIRWAKHYRDEKFPNGVPVGPGRGSGAGSLVAYSLLITELDPLRYELLFERFLNPERVSMPDFDVDFCQDGRELVIEYVRKKYGAANVSQIATFGTMASKAVIRDVGRVLEFPYGLCDRLSKLVPLEGVKPVSLKKAREIEPEFNTIVANEEGVDELLELGERLEDLTRNVGMHAGGVLIAPGKLTDFCPLYCAEGGADGEDKKTISQFDKDDVEAVGLVKFDFLGLRTLTIIDWAVRYVRILEQVKGGITTPFAIETLPLDDKQTYDLLKKANTSAVFQLESHGMKKLIDKLQPDNFEDIVALVALYRPGPLESGMVEDFIARKHGKAKADYFHPELETSLKPTYGVIVYQEQVMQIAQIIGGYTLGGADMLRRAMGKKNVDEMATQRDIFVRGALRRGIEETLATRLFDLMEMFAGYGFNKSHSAAYALVSYQTAYLKAHYPAAFMAATLSSDMDNTDKVRNFFVDTQEQGVAILPPDINLSDYRFVPVDEKTIAYGLGAIKGTGEAAIINLVAARKNGKFLNLFDFCHRVDNRIVNRRALEALIRAGAFDSISTNRAQLLANLDLALASADQKTRSAKQNNLFGEDEQAKLPVKMLEMPPWGLREALENEKNSLGFYLSGHPFQEFSAELAQFIKIKLNDVTPAMLPQGGQNRRAGKEVLLAGMVADIRIQQSRRGRMAIIKLEDGSAQLEVTAFNELYEPSRAWIKEGALLIIKGRASFDEYSGSMRINADEIFDLASARATFAKRLEICVNGERQVTAEELVGLFKPWCGGKCNVLISYNNADSSAQILLGEDWRVTLPDQLLKELSAHFGANQVQIIY